MSTRRRRPADGPRPGAGRRAQPRRRERLGGADALPRAGPPVQRDPRPAAAPAGQQRALTRKDNFSLDNARRLIDKAKTNKDAALTARW